MTRGQRVAKIDGHVHVFRAVSERYPRAEHPMYPADMEAPVEDLLETLDRNDVDGAIVVPLSPHDEYLAECLANHPERLRGIGVLSSDRIHDAGDARRRFAEVGLSGLRVFRLGDPATARPQELDAWPVLEMLQEVDGVLWLYVSAEELKLLPRVLDRLPKLKVVLNHLGWPLPEEFHVDELGRPSVPWRAPPPTLDTVRQLAGYEGVHVMFSGEYAFSGEAFPFSDLTGVVTTIYESYGAERMMWASDYPWIREAPGYDPQLGLVDHYLPNLSPGEKQAIMGGTASRLFDW
jgi:L-fuconolactonase